MQEALAVTEFIQQIRRFPDQRKRLKYYFFHLIYYTRLQVFTIYSCISKMLTHIFVFFVIYTKIKCNE